VQEKKLHEINADKGKLKVKTIRSRNSAELINQKEVVEVKTIFMSCLFLQALSFPYGVCTALSSCQQE
jgi:hypothetical protein